MKTHLLVLEAHDDLVSVRDRMSWAKTPRILLVWPVGQRVQLRPVDLKLLERHAHSLGARLGLITRDRAVRREAAALGLPVFRSNAAAQRDHWPTPVKRTFRQPTRVDLRALQSSVRPGEARWKSSLIARILFFALGVAATLAIVAVFIPRAEIRLSPETKTQTLILPVVADPALDFVFITGSVPAREWTREAVESREIVSSGFMMVPLTEAEGVARFSNLTAVPVIIPAGTVIQTLGADPARFVTMQDTQVAGGAGKFVETPIRSVNAGERGNLEADTLKAIEGPLGLSLTVTNPKPTTGGSDSKVAAPSDADRQRVRSAALGGLARSSLGEIPADLPEGSILLPDTAEVTEVLEETYDPPAGEAGVTLTLRLRVKLTTRYVTEDDLRQLAALSLDAALEDEFIVAPDSLTAEPIPPLVTGEDGRTRFSMNVERRLVRALDVRRALLLVQGRKPEVARAQLAQLSGLTQPPQILLTPDWWPWLPLVPFRINVVIQ